MIYQDDFKKFHQKMEMILKEFVSELQHKQYKKSKYP